ncbi:MAG: chemotaxis protein CheX [Planctomycetales bacterium]|nr:chemotaxis protein CheX [Planctomycetales bacterium]
MRAEHINPFLRSIANTFETMLGCDLQRGEIVLKKQKNLQFPISGVIGLTGKAVGTVVINLSEAVALNAASTMLMMECGEVDEDVIDAVGEIANMVAGAAKAELEEFDLSVSLPNVVTGEKHDIKFPSNATPICVPFQCKWGPLQLEVGLETVGASVAHA